MLSSNSIFSLLGLVSSKRTISLPCSKLTLKRIFSVAMLSVTGPLARGRV